MSPDQSNRLARYDWIASFQFDDTESEMGHSDTLSLRIRKESHAHGHGLSCDLVIVIVKVKGGDAVPRHIHNVEDVLRLAKLARRNEEGMTESSLDMI